LDSRIVDFYPPLSDMQFHFLERFGPGVVQLGFSALMVSTLAKGFLSGRFCNTLRDQVA